MSDRTLRWPGSAAAIGAAIGLPTAMPGVPHHWFVTAERTATPQRSLDVGPGEDQGG